MANYMKKNQDAAELSSNLRKVTLKSAINSVKCVACNRLHDIESESFLTFFGNVHLGYGKGGIVGNNLSPDMRVISSTFYCANISCMKHILHLSADISTLNKEEKPVRKAMKKAPKSQYDNDDEEDEEDDI